MALPTTQTLLGVSSLDDATCEYAGFTFDSTRQVTCRATNFYADDNETVLGVRRVYTIKGYLYDSTNSSDFAEYMYREMMLPRQTLRIIDNGISNITIGPNNDINDGPRPMDLNLEPVGASRAYVFTFVIEVVIPVCCDEGGGCNVLVTGGRARALQYTIDWDISEGQFSTRTVSGYLEIDANRIGGQAGEISHNADQLRESLANLHPPLPNFQRTQHYSESLNKKRLNFAITDRQIESPNCYPKGVTNISGKHRVRWARGKEGAVLVNHINLEIELDQRANALTACVVFLDTLFSRVTYAERQGMTVFLDSVEVTDDFYSYNASFAATYRLLGKTNNSGSGSGGIGSAFGSPGTGGAISNPAAFGTVGPGSILASGLFEATPDGQSFDGWKNWQAVDRLQPRGAMGLTDAGNAFGSASACYGITDGTGRVDQNRNPPVQTYYPPSRTLVNKKPPKGDSYLYYDNGIMESSENPVSLLPYTQETPEETDTPNVGSESNNPLGSTGASEQNSNGDTGGQTTDPESDFKNLESWDSGLGRGTDHEIQSSGITRQTFIIAGAATRVGYKIPRPTIDKLGTQELTEVSRKFVQKQVAYQFGQPVYSAAWKIEYIAPNTAGTIEVLKNFQQAQVDGVA